MECSKGYHELIVCPTQKGMRLHKLRMRVIEEPAGEAFRVRWGCFGERLLLTVRKGVMRMKWLNLIIKILHILAVIGTYAAVFELILTAIRAVLSFLGF